MEYGSVVVVVVVVQVCALPPWFLPFFSPSLCSSLVAPPPLYSLAPTAPRRALVSSSEEIASAYPGFGLRKGPVLLLLLSFLFCDNAFSATSLILERLALGSVCQRSGNCTRRKCFLPVLLQGRGDGFAAVCLEERGPERASPCWVGAFFCPPPLQSRLVFGCRIPWIRRVSCPCSRADYRIGCRAFPGGFGGAKPKPPNVQLSFKCGVHSVVASALFRLPQCCRVSAKPAVFLFFHIPLYSSGTPAGADNSSGCFSLTL